MFEEINLNNIKSDLKRKYDLKVEIKGNKLCCDEFNGYIKNDDTFLEVEQLCESICYWIEGRYNCFSSFSILDTNGYEFTIEVF